MESKVFKEKLRVFRSCGDIYLKRQESYRTVIVLSNLPGASSALKLSDNDIVEITLKKVQK